MMEKVGSMIEPYTAGLDELQRMSADIRQNKARIRKILLNPSLMCSGNGRKVIQALRSAGVNP